MEEEMIQVTVIDQNNKYHGVAYLQLVQREGDSEGWRMIWTEKGHTQKSGVCFFSPSTSKWEIISRLYQNKAVDDIAL